MSGARRTTKATKVSTPADLPAAAGACDIDSSAGAEHRLRPHWREAWLAQNAEGIEAYNRDVQVHGSFGDTLRTF